MNKKVIALIAALTLAAGMISGCGASSNTTTGSVAESSSTQTQDEEKVTPTFMYFVSNGDADFDKTQSMIEELKKEYDGKINFNIINIDEDSEAAKNFPVQGNTPALIMLNTSNDISALEFQCADKDKLKTDIETALQ